MRGVKVLVSRGPFLSQSSNYSRAFHKIAKSPPSRPSIQQHKPFAFRMASTNAAEEKWNAKHVRETFFRYFVEDNGHTFGRSPLAASVSFFGADEAPSSIFFCCSA